MVTVNLRRLFLSAVSFLSFVCLPVSASAEGSKDMYPKDYFTKYFGKDMSTDHARRFRAMLVSGTASNRPFPTYGTMKVYAKAGEHIYLASSALNSSQTGTSTGSIVWRSPNGTTGTITNYSNGGYIPNRAAELAGPQYGTFTGGNRYKAYKIEVTTETEGVWEIDFRSKATSLVTTPAGKNTGTATSSPHSSEVNATAWVENESGTPNIKNGNTIAENVYVSAFDITVTNSDDDAVINGRVFANVLNMAIWGAADYASQWCATLYVLTNTGYMYQLEPNGMSGDALCVYANNKGVQTGGVSCATWNGGGTYPNSNYQSCEAGQPSYKSAAFGSSSVDIYDPRRPDNVTTYMDADGKSVDYYEDVTHKIFFNKPAADLPEKAPCVYGNTVSSTWLRKELGAGLPKITDIKFVGKESGKEAIWGPEGCNIVFDADVQGSYTIVLKFADSKFKSRTIEGVCVPGKNMIIWDGKDGADVDFDGSCAITPSGQLSAAEVHFPFANVYRNVNGYRLLLLDPTNGMELSRTLYWDDNGDIPDKTVGTYDSALDGTAGSKCSDLSTAAERVSDNTKGYSKYGHCWGIKYRAYVGFLPKNVWCERGKNAIIDSWSFAQGESSDCAPTTFKKEQLDLQVTGIGSAPTTAHVHEEISFEFTVKNAKSGIYTSDADGASVGVWFENGGFYTTKFEIVSTSDASTKILNSPAEEERELCYIFLKNQASATFRITGYLASRHAHAYAQPKAFIMRPGDVVEKDAKNTKGDGAPVNPLEEYDIKTCNNIKDFPQIFLLNSAPAPIDDEYSAAEGDTFVDNVLDNDNDVDADNLTVTKFTVDGTDYAAGAEATIDGVGTLKIDSGGTITLVTGAELFSSFSCSYTVSDGFAGNYLKDQDLIPGVATANVKFTYGQNRIPRVEPTAVTIKSSRKNVELPINIYDLDGDPLTISLSGANASKFTVIDDRLYYVGGARTTQAIYHFDLSVSDGTVTTVKNIDVTVLPVNPPTISPNPVELTVPNKVGTYVVPVVIKSDDGVQLIPNGGVTGASCFEVKDGNLYFIGTAESLKNKPYNLVINVKDGEGLEYFLNLQVNVKIKTLASASITINPKNGVYGCKLSDVLTYTANNNIAGTWEVKDQNYISYDADDILPVGKYTFQVTFCPDPNNAYGIKDNVVKSASLEISKRTINLESGSGSWVYDQLAHRNETVTEVSGDGFFDTDGLIFTNFASQTDVGSCQNTFSYFPKSGTDLDNYNIQVTYGTLEVTQRNASVDEMVVNLSENSFVYAKKAHEPSVSLYIAGKLVPATEYTVTYADNTDVGTATVTITDNAGGNYDMPTVSTTFIITPYEVSLTWSETTLEYNAQTNKSLRP